jgi:manganese/zinc/iron transport system ATP- binding protein
LAQKITPEKNYICTASAMPIETMPTPLENILEVHNLSAGYDLKPVLWNIDFELPAGTLAAIIGPNGAGKSTLIKSILGLVPQNSGYVKFFGQNLNEIRHKISYVPQRESVDWDFPISVREVVEMGLYKKRGLFRRLSKTDKQLAMQCLEKTGMAEYAERQIAKLSGGQQQRVFIARSLAQQADLYFMDEPFAGVDMATEAKIVEILRDMKNEGKTAVIVHHDLTSVADYFDYIAMINTRMVAFGKTSEIFTQENLNETYGGKLPLLTRITELMKSQKFPATDKTIR